METKESFISAKCEIIDTGIMVHITTNKRVVEVNITSPHYDLKSYVKPSYRGNTYRGVKVVESAYDNEAMVYVNLVYDEGMQSIVQVPILYIELDGGFNYSLKDIPTKGGNDNANTPN